MDCVPGAGGPFLAVALWRVIGSVPRRKTGPPDSFRVARDPGATCSLIGYNNQNLSMPLSAGDKLGPYEILAPLGAGGMGEVYRGRDSKLNRDVAIKVLPEALAGDTQYMARFEREALVLASLNHPNIATVYGIEQGALVMELVEGADLRGPLPLEEAIPIARQIAEGLEAAHERGIIHRDLKPANIKLTPAGVVKILDFGLAKSAGEFSAVAPGSSPTMSPTLSLAMTQAGMILGTAAYMSPEQARGKPVDRRADIWAFGIVLYEMLTGEQLFGGGETVTDTLASVVKDAPDFGKLPADTPPHIRRLLERCLRKDVKTRLQAIGEARIMLDEARDAAASPTMQATATRRSWLPWALAGVSVVLALALGGLLWRATRPMEKPLLRFSTDLGPEAVADNRITTAISPDGTRLAYPVRPAGGTVNLLATRLMDQSKPTVLSGTENAADPFFSPNGQWIGFFADGHLRKVSIQGGAPTTLCDAAAMRGADWGEDGNVVFGVAGGAPLARVPSSGGTPQSLAKPTEKGTSQRWPQILPGGHAILFTGGTVGSFDDASIEVLILKTGETKMVQRGGYFGRYLSSGHLVYIHQGTLFAVPFDLDRNQTRGMPAPILEDVAGNVTNGGGQMDFSRTGTLVYLSGKSGATTFNLSWLDALGKKEPLLADPLILGPRFSLDGKRLVYFTTADISVYDLARGSTTRLPVQNGDGYPVWTPDGKHIVYESTTGLFWVRSDGSGPPQRIYESKAGSPVAWSFTPHGRRLAFHQAGEGTGRDIWTLPLDTSDPDHPKAGAAELFLATKGNDVEPVFSPDGRWLAYASGESGSYHIFVRPFPEGATGGGQAQISTTPGRFPLWSRTAKELFYLTADGHIMVVPYTINGRSFEPGKPRQWVGNQIILTGNSIPYDLAPDGKRFAVFLAPEASAGAEKANLHMIFLLNFFDELKRRIPPGGIK